MDRKTTGGSADPIPADLTFEAALKELEAIVVRLERGELTLDDSIRQYERGEALKRHCAALLDRAEQRIERIRVGEGGEAAGVAPLDPE